MKNIVKEILLFISWVCYNGGELLLHYIIAFITNITVHFYVAS